MDITRLKHNVTDADITWVGVAICRNSDGSRHTGIIYRGEAGEGEAGELRMADMAWHELFRDQPYSPAWGYSCAVPQFDDEVIEQSFADFCAHVGKSLAQNRPPYDLLAANPDAFDKDGNWVPRDPDVGFNCSSFVIGVFAAYNHPLVKPETWPIGLPQDIQEQTSLVCKLLNSREPRDRAQAIKISPQIGKYPRIRPEQAAGACLEDQIARPLAHAECEANGLRVLQEWDAHHR
jgi:hypothetical protein